MQPATRMGLWALLSLGAAGCAESTLSTAPEAPTFTRDVAPVVFEHCATCHRPGQSAPFSLLTHHDVAKRSRQIAEVVASGFMPPWLPAPGNHAFEHERRLSNAQIETLARWHANGAPEGDPNDLSGAPADHAGWTLGEPDLVIETQQPYALAADGEDEFRNLILRVPIDSTRFVRAIELRPGTTGVIHHAIINVDRRGGCRKLAAQDAMPGFAGMGMGTSEPPDGHFLGWTPGRMPYQARANMSWRLYPGDDLVLQLHMTKTGKPEQVAPSLGLYFSPTPPTLFPHTVVLFSEDIDIPAGARAHRVDDTFTLPVDVDLLGVYPHAHYVGDRVTGTATRPDKSVDELIRIDEWDFNWQDEYRYQQPIFLPAGTTLSMHWVYDNSADNPRNPNQPPARVRFGERSADEMGTLSFLVLPRNPAHIARLEEARWRRTIEKKPYDWDAFNSLGSLIAGEQRLEEAAALFRAALQLRPDYADALSNLGLVTLRMGQAAPALELLQRALDAEPEHALANTLVARALGALGRGEEAVAHLRALVVRHPDRSAARLLLADLLAIGGQTSQALSEYRTLIDREPNLPEAHNNLANTLFALDQIDAAIEQYGLAIAARPDYFNAQLNRGRALLKSGRRVEAARNLRSALRLQPGHALALSELARAQERP